MLNEDFTEVEWVRQTDQVLVIKDRCSARVAAPVPKEPEQLPGPNRARVVQERASTPLRLHRRQSWGKPKRIIVQVKSGHVNRGMIATLKGDMEREEAEIGVFITLQPPTEPMRQEALSAGVYTPEHFPDQQCPRLQILTIDDLFSDRQVAYPRGGAPATFRQAPRRRRSQGRQNTLV